VAVDTLGDRVGGRQRSEPAPEGLERIIAEVLVAEEHHAPVVQRLDEVAGRRGVERRAEVDAGNLGTDHRRHRLDLDAAVAMALLFLGDFAR